MPSARYTRPMPTLSPEAMRTWMTLDPVGAKVFQAHQDAMDMTKNGANQGGGQQTATASPQRPPAVPANAIWNAQGNNGKGAWQLPQQ